MTAQTTPDRPQRTRWRDVITAAIGSILLFVLLQYVLGIPILIVPR